jgi:hypothetical protein
VSAAASRLPRGATAVLATAALTATLASCATEGDKTAATVTTDGPLSVTAGSGGSSLTPPATAAGSSWAGSFGGFVLCRNDDSRVTLDKVVPVEEVPAEQLHVFVRTVAPAKPGTRRDPNAYTPIISARGSAPDFAEPYVTGPVSGSYTRTVDGVAVNDRCGKGRPVRTGFTELLFTLHSGPGGAQVTSFTIYYTADGKEYAAPVSWQMVACGSEIGPDICPRR